MTTADPEFLRTVVDELSSLGPIRQRPYFGGVALVFDDKQFAFVMGATLYLATNPESRRDLRDRGGQPFEYMTRSGPRIVECNWRRERVWAAPAPSLQLRTSVLQ